MPAPKKPPVLSERKEEGPEPVSRNNAYVFNWWIEYNQLYRAIERFAGAKSKQRQG